MDYATRPLFQYVFDSSSLINIERRRRVKYLRKRYHEIILPEKVAEEVKTPGYPLERFLAHYPSVITTFTTSEEEQYLQIRGQSGIHDGEAAAMTVALSRQLPLVIEDKKGRKSWHLLS
jgi:predicted nucleic acid-binding protein